MSEEVFSDYYPYMTISADKSYQFDNERQVAKVGVLDCRPSPQTNSEFVVVIATKEELDVSPFHFRIGEYQLRDFVAKAGRLFDPAQKERHQILESLERIEDSLGEILTKRIQPR